MLNARYPEFESFKELQKYELQLYKEIPPATIFKLEPFIVQVSNPLTHSFIVDCF